MQKSLDSTRRKITVGIATTGRADVLAKTVAHLSKQSRLPDRIVISAIAMDDCAGVEKGDIPVQIITGGKGLAQQRNCILDLAEPEEVVVFFDDDFVPDNAYLEQTETIFAENDDIVMLTGHVLADGILTSGISFEEAVRIVTTSAAPDDRLIPVYNAYGCNMAVRVDALNREHARCDENLPLYSWLEDVDFSRVLARQGRIVRAGTACGVHMGAKTGRTAGQRLGYSQMVNPYYLARKGTVAWTFGLRLALRNLAANLIKSVRPEPYVDRYGRLKGNLHGIADIVLGRADPKRVLDM